MHPLIEKLIGIYGRIGVFHITPCDGDIPISEADRLAEEAVEEYTKAIIAEQAAEIKRLLEALELADAALRGANMDMKVVERKVAAALGKAE